MNLKSFPLGYFGVAAGTCSQAVLWRALTTVDAVKEFNIPEGVSFAFWVLGLLVLTIITGLHIVRAIVYPETLRKEYFHPIASNLYFMAILAGSFLLNGAPNDVRNDTGFTFAWCLLCALYFLVLGDRMKIWLFTKPLNFVRNQNPAYFLSTINGMLLGTAATTPEFQRTVGRGWSFISIFLLSIGVFLYFLLVVLFFPRLTRSAIARDWFFPKSGSPMFILIIAPPSASAVTVFGLTGTFNVAAQFFFAVGTLFLFSIICKSKRLVKLKYSLFWWAYVFPLAAFANACLLYANEDLSVFPAVGFSFMKYIGLVFAGCSTSFWIINSVGTIRLTFISPPKNTAPDPEEKLRQIYESKSAKAIEV